MTHRSEGSIVTTDERIASMTRDEIRMHLRVERVNLTKALIEKKRLRTQLNEDIADIEQRLRDITASESWLC